MKENAGHSREMVAVSLKGPYVGAGLLAIQRFLVSAQAVFSKSLAVGPQSGE